MLRPREIKRKIAAIENTRKITRTMEMVATARATRNQSRLKSAVPYAEALEHLYELWKRYLPPSHPLLRRTEYPRRAALLVVTSNRGLCGAYNTDILRLAEERIGGLEESGCRVRLYVAGKRGIRRLCFLGWDLHWKSSELDDRPSWEQSCALADRLRDDFEHREVDLVEVVSMRFYSPGNEEACVTQMLPISYEAPGKEEEPLMEGPREVFAVELLRAVLRMRLFRLLLEAGTSEQFARRIAMRAATENAEEMIKQYRLAYYRARQSSITLELMDIIGGANALREQG